MKKNFHSDNNKPLIPAEKILPEITFKAVILAILLAVLLGASNAYLALKVGNTIAASIPASVIALGVFRLFKKSNVLESNLVQTAASAGEGLATISAFILPALIILGYWSDFKYWQVVIITMLGGILGVCFSVPLRGVLLNHKALLFPEGTAIGNVLRASASGAKQMALIIRGALVGGLIILSQTGFRIIADHLPLWFKKGNTIFGLNFGFNPALIGVGYIVGVNPALTMFLGTIIGWVIGIPILSSFYGLPAGVTGIENMAMTLWTQHIRYIGVGTMLVGGIWTLVTMLKPMTKGISLAFNAIKTNQANRSVVIRTEKDIDMIYVLLGALLLTFLIFFILFYSIRISGLGISHELMLVMSLVGSLYILIFGLFSSLISGYIVGLVGSSNTPISGINIMNLLLLMLIFTPLAALGADLSVHANQQAIIAIVIFMLVFVASAAVITNENIQDLKAGQMVGATPWKQQLMMIIGVVAASLVVSPVLHLLFQAYGIGGIFPHPNMDPSQMLAAPQSGLVAALARGAIGHSLPLNMIFIGVAIGIVVVIIDEILKRKSTVRLPALGVGIGIYLPPEVVTCVAFGGLIRFFANRALRKKTHTLPKDQQEQLSQDQQQRSILLACGLVAGSSLTGVILAIPFVIAGNSDVLRLVSDRFMPFGIAIGVVVTILLCTWLYQTTLRIKK